MSAGNVHLIVTCTRRKTVAAGDAVFPDERDVERANGLWLERLAQAHQGTSPMTPSMSGARAGFIVPARPSE